jgi:glyoxylase-like metal-dependent hydrolase (beta-lactamase superfamily II)
MTRPRVLDLGAGRQLVDLDFRDTEGLVAAYLLPQEGGWTLIETGPTTCHAALLAGLARAGVEPAEVRRVFVTHIHLDHAGGLGALAGDLPNADFYAHEVGVPHLADPSRLVASARRAWGPAMDVLWGNVLPVPAPRLHPLVGTETFPLTGGTLTVVATPGHAKHHLSFFDSALAGVFTGDSAGVRLERSDHVRPAVPPPDLDLEQLYDSLDRMRALAPRRVFLSHFGATPNGAADLAQYRTVVEQWRDVALAAARERPEPGYVGEALRRHDASVRPPSRDDPSSLVSGYELAAMGFLRYFETHGELPPRTG